MLAAFDKDLELEKDLMLSTTSVTPILSSKVNDVVDSDAARDISQIKPQLSASEVDVNLGANTYSP